MNFDTVLYCTCCLSVLQNQISVLTAEYKIFKCKNKKKLKIKCFLFSYALKVWPVKFFSKRWREWNQKGCPAPEYNCGLCFCLGR